MNALLLALLALGLLVWFWQDSLRARERAREASGKACRQINVQLLDDTVALDRLWFRRDAEGRLRLERTYQFEFTANGAERRLGRLVMIGATVEVLYMEGEDLFIP